MIIMIMTVARAMPPPARDRVGASAMPVPRCHVTTAGWAQPAAAAWAEPRIFSAIATCSVGLGQTRAQPGRNPGRSSLSPSDHTFNFGRPHKQILDYETMAIVGPKSLRSLSSLLFAVVSPTLNTAFSGSIGPCPLLKKLHLKPTPTMPPMPNLGTSLAGWKQDHFRAVRGGGPMRFSLFSASKRAYNALTMISGVF